MRIDMAVIVLPAPDSGGADAPPVRARGGDAVGYVRARVHGDGQMHHAAISLDATGRQRPAGTYATEAQATRAWQKAEEKITEGRLGDPPRLSTLRRSAAVCAPLVFPLPLPLPPPWAVGTRDQDHGSKGAIV
jgi:hypothetical protein